MSEQEYYDLVKREDAYIAVEKNAAGSRPKELFEDILEEVEEQFDADRTVLKVSRNPMPMRKPTCWQFGRSDHRHSHPKES